MIVYVSIGSNMSDGESMVKTALRYLTTVLSGIRISSVYSTPSVSGDGRTYFNAVAAGQWSDSIELLNTLFKQYEVMAGRKPKQKSGGDVPLDLDIVMAGDSIIRPADYTREYFLIGYRELQCS